MLNTQTFSRFLLLAVAFILSLLFVINESNTQDRALIEELTPQLHQLDEKVDKLESENRFKDRKIKDLEKELKDRPVTRISDSKATLDCSKYISLFERYDWDVTIAMAIMKSESGCNPNIVSPTNDYGLMQLNNINITDPAKNIEYA